MTEDNENQRAFTSEEFLEILNFLQSRISFDFGSCAEVSIKLSSPKQIEISSVSFANPRRDKDEEVIMKSEIDGSTRTVKMSELCLDND